MFRNKDEAVQGEIVERREAPEERSIVPANVLNPVLNDAQMEQVLTPTPKWAIKKRQGRDQKIFSYVTHGYVTDTLNKIFGFDWDLVIDPMSDGKMYALELEEVKFLNKKSKQIETKTNRHIAVVGHITVRVRNPKNPKEVLATITKYGFGSQMWNSTMELGDALKGARSDLLKTCAFQLGIALDLYWNEQAELDQYNDRIEQAKMREEEAANLAEQLAGAPKTGALFMSRAMSEFGMNAEAINQEFDVGMDVLLKMGEEELAELWKKVKEKSNETQS